jgi:hypothetical protein
METAVGIETGGPNLHGTDREDGRCATGQAHHGPGAFAHHADETTAVRCVEVRPDAVDPPLKYDVIGSAPFGGG